MAEENIPHVDEKCCLDDDDAKSMEIIEETSVETMPLMDEEIQGDDVLILPTTTVSNEVNHVNLRRYSTGLSDKRVPSKAQTRYRGNQMSSTHDLCKHGKRREEDLAIKPWKLVKKKNVVGGDLVRSEALGVMRRKSLGSVSKPEKSLQVARRDASASDIVKSCDGLRVKRSETKSNNPSDSAGVRLVKKTNLDAKKVSRSSENKSSKVDPLKNLKKIEKVKTDEPVRCEDVLEKRVSKVSENQSSKEDFLRRSMNNKEKTEIDEPVRCDDVSEKTLYVVESSIEEKMMKKKSVKSETQQSSEKKILRSNGKKSLTILPTLIPSSRVVVKEPRVTRSDPRPIRQTTSKSNTSLSEKKETGSANLVTSSKRESKIRLKRIGLKATPPPPGPQKRPLIFKKGKVLEPKLEDSTPTLIKFKKRVVQEPKLRSDVNKKKKKMKNQKDKREGVGKISYTNGEGKREKVVLKHRKVEAKKKLQTLFNNVIEETVNKLEEVRKSKVKALVGAFETVISLQDNDRTSQKKKIQSKTTSSQVVEG